MGRWIWWRINQTNVFKSKDDSQTHGEPVTNTKSESVTLLDLTWHYVLITDLEYLLKSEGYKKSAVWWHSSIFCTKEFQLKDMSEFHKKQHIKTCVEHNGSLENEPLT